MVSFIQQVYKNINIGPKKGTHCELVYLSQELQSYTVVYRSLLNVERYGTGGFEESDLRKARRGRGKKRKEETSHYSNPAMEAVIDEHSTANITSYLLLSAVFKSSK